MLHAGHLHDLGRVGVAAGIWAKPSALSSGERERLQLHAYYSERIVARTTAFADLGTVVGMHHERLDGSGYHRSAVGRDIPMAARLLAAADAYRTMLEDRPHRAALVPDAAAERFRERAAAGAFDIDAVDAILAVVGQQTRPIVRELPAGLTSRELEVLRLMARGCSNQEVADELVISRRTAEHHVQHIYDKIGVSTRAGASMFAVRHDLLATLAGG
jgi:HD-GYP domain-containing protein (c-di-GMP phosphodiesterase class II)